MIAVVEVVDARDHSDHFDQLLPCCLIDASIESEDLGARRSNRACIDLAEILFTGPSVWFDLVWAMSLIISRITSCKLC